MAPLSPRRKFLEDLLAEKKLAKGTAAFETTFEPEGLVTGKPEWDAILGHGFRKGRVGEIVGGASTGRTALGLALAAAAAREDLVAWIDPLDRLSPHAARLAGVDFRNFAWLRGSPERERPLATAVAATQALAAASLFDLVILDFSDVPERLLKALPAAWTLRLVRAFEPTETAGVVLSRAHWGASPRGLSLRLRGERAAFASAGKGQLLRKRPLVLTQNWPLLKTASLELDAS